MPQIKFCTKCRAEKPVDDFGKNRDGWQAWCKDCMRAYTAANREAAAARSRRFRAKNQDKCYAINAVKNAIKQGKLKRPKGMEFHHPSPERRHALWVIPMTKTDHELHHVVVRGAKRMVEESYACY